MENNTPAEHHEPLKARTGKRPFLCTVILSIALTYFTLLALLFLSGLIFSGKIIAIITPYMVDSEKSPGLFLPFALTGTLLFLTASAGIVIFFMKKKWGFYLFFAAALAIFGLDFLVLTFDWIRYLALSGFIFLLGMAHFTGRCYR